MITEKKSMQALAQDMADKITEMGGLKYLHEKRVSSTDRIHYTRVLLFDPEQSAPLFSKTPCFAYIKAQGRQGIFLFGAPSMTNAVRQSPYLTHVLSQRDGLFGKSVVAKNPAVSVVIDNTLIRCNTPAFFRDYGYMLYNTKETEASQAIAFLCYLRLVAEMPYWITKYDEVLATRPGLSPRVAQVILNDAGIGGLHGHSPLIPGVMVDPKNLAALLKERCSKPVGSVAKTGIITSQSSALLEYFPYSTPPCKNLDHYINEGVKLYEASL